MAQHRRYLLPIIFTLCIILPQVFLPADGSAASGVISPQRSPSTEQRITANVAQEKLRALPGKHVQPQPTPPIAPDVNPSPQATEAPSRPLPNSIVPRVIAPSPRKPITPRSTIPQLLWEAPVGPASNWQNTENYLILGTDRRQGSGDWRTDVIMIVGLDRERERTVVFSIPRDLYVNIPNYGMGRINQADFLGERNPDLHGSGPQLISTIISQTLGIQTDHWVRFQMDGFVRIVDAIGGVNVYLDCPFAEPIFNLDTQSWEYFTLPAGDNWMDGETAYWFVRLRLRSSDIERASRQRQFLWALRNQMINANLLVRFPELWRAFSDSFATDLTLFELIDLTRLGLSYGSDNVRAGGLTLADLNDITTDRGAAVLGIGDPGRVRAVVNGVWEAQAMAATNRRAPEECAPLPQGVPQMGSAPGTNVLEGNRPITATLTFEEDNR